MTGKPISRYPVPSLDAMPEDMRARILEVQQKSGFVTNVFLALAHRPDEFRAFFAYHDALMLKESGLTKGEREMIVVATSGANDCVYCVVAHGAILRIYEKNPHIADQVATNYRKADIPPRQKAMLTFAMKVATAAGTIEDADFEALRVQRVEVLVDDLARALRDLEREREHRLLPRRDVGLAVVRGDLIGDLRVLRVNAQDRAVGDDAVHAVVRARGGDDDHLPLRLGESAFLQHQRVVVGEEGAELVGPVREREEHVGHEAGLLLHLDDARADVLRQVLEPGDRVARDRAGAVVHVHRHVFGGT